MGHRPVFDFLHFNDGDRTGQVDLFLLPVTDDDRIAQDLDVRMEDERDRVVLPDGIGLVRIPQAGYHQAGVWCHLDGKTAVRTGNHAPRSSGYGYAGADDGLAAIIQDPPAEDKRLGLEGRGWILPDDNPFAVQSRSQVLRGQRPVDHRNDILVLGRQRHRFLQVYIGIDIGKGITCLLFHLTEKIPDGHSPELSGDGSLRGKRNSGTKRQEHQRGAEQGMQHRPEIVARNHHRR